jgi:hypothetical protein
MNKSNKKLCYIFKRINKKDSIIIDSDQFNIKKVRVKKNEL